MRKKYELTSETKVLPDGTTLYRIRSLAKSAHFDAGELGGFIEKESNLSQDGICWVANEAMVYGDAKVLHDAIVSDHAVVCDNAIVCICATISGHARISDYARIEGFSSITGQSSLNWLTTARGTKMEDFNIVTESTPSDRLYSSEYIKRKDLERKESRHNLIKDLLWPILTGVFGGIAVGTILVCFH